MLILVVACARYPHAIILLLVSFMRRIERSYDGTTGRYYGASSGIVWTRQLHTAQLGGATGTTAVLLQDAVRAVGIILVSLGVLRAGRPLSVVDVGRGRNATSSHSTILSTNCFAFPSEEMNCKSLVVVCFIESGCTSCTQIEDVGLFAVDPSFGE